MSPEVTCLLGILPEISCAHGIQYLTFYFLKITALSKYNSHTVKFSPLTRTFPWFLVASQGCVTVTTATSSQNIFASPQRAPHPLAMLSVSPRRPGHPFVYSPSLRISLFWAFRVTSTWSPVPLSTAPSWLVHVAVCTSLSLGLSSGTSVATSVCTYVYFLCLAFCSFIHPGRDT